MVVLCVLTILVGGFCSRAAGNGVLPDTDPPTVLGADETPGLDGAIVTFSEPVDPSSATGSFNYILGPSGSPIVASASMASGSEVLLGFSPLLTAGTVYDLEVFGVTDLAGNPIDPDPSRVSFATAPTAADVPEPCTFLLCSLGLLAAGYAGRRRRRAA
jgi:hypothetical protein